jgi:hypothetical protein
VAVMVPAMPTVVPPVMIIAVMMVPVHFRHLWPGALLNRSGAWIDQRHRLRALGGDCQCETGADRREAKNSHQLHRLGSSIARRVARRLRRRQREFEQRAVNADGRDLFRASVRRIARRTVAIEEFSLAVPLGGADNRPAR